MTTPETKAPATWGPEIMTKRKVRLSDLMILVAAFAVGGGVSRYASLGLSQGEFSERFATFPSLAAFSYWPIIISACLWPASAALLLLRSFHPRPPDAYCRPGMVACISSNTGMGMASFPAICKLGVDWMRFGMRSEVLGYPRLRMVMTISFVMSITIITGWIALAVCRKWRWDGDWVELLGCLVGACGVAVYPLWLLLGPYEMFVWY
jgi:hypothetical protein